MKAKNKGPACRCSADWVSALQRAWAVRNGHALLAPSGKYSCYVKKLEDNLALGWLGVRTRADFMRGGGYELSRKGESAPKMQALYSSSAMAVNVFDYWRENGDMGVPVKACGLPGGDITDIEFEWKQSVPGGRSFCPNVDAWIRYADGLIAGVECKMVEPYRDKHDAFKSAYLEKKEQWRGWSNVRRQAERLNRDGPRFVHLDETQLITRLLALRAATGSPDTLRLVYLWYDVPVPAGERHRREAGHFGNVLKRDGIPFISVTCQEIVDRLQKVAAPKHVDYVSWMAKRYIGVL